MQTTTTKNVEYDHELRVWLVDGIVQPCDHPFDPSCCNARHYVGLSICEATARHHAMEEEV